MIAAAGFVAYGNSVNDTFLFDDSFLVENNTYIRNASGISKIFRQGIGRDTVETSYYRPVQMLSYMADYSLWKLDPRGYHVTNIIFHILAALCVYWLVSILFCDRLLSLLTGILFVAHPVHAGAVSYISGRADSMAALFMLLCMIFYIKCLQKLNNAGSYLLMLCSYALALLSKESSLILPLLLVFYHYAFKRKFEFKPLLCILSLTLIYIPARVLSVVSAPLEYAKAATTVSQRLPGFFIAVADYVRIVFLPFGLHMEYGNKLFSFHDGKAILGALLVVFLLIYAFRKRNTNGLLFFSVFWFFLALLPVSNLYPLNAYMAEHWLYLPSIGVFLIMAAGLKHIFDRTRNRRALSIVLIIGAVSFYSYLAIKQNNYWREPIYFYERTIKYSPDSAKAYNNLGTSYKDAGRAEEAVAAYKRAIAIDPAFVMAYNNLGSIYKDMGKVKEAVTAYEDTIRVSTDYEEAHYNLALLYSEIGETEEAIAFYKKAIEINPGYVEAYSNLGVIYGAIGKTEEAVAVYKKAIEIDPNYATAHNNLGLAYYGSGNMEEAIRMYKRAIELRPGYSDAYINLGIAYKNTGKIEDAIALYKEALKVKPDSAAAHYNLAVAYYLMRQYDLVVKHVDAATGLGYKVAPAFLDEVKQYRK